MLAYLLLCSVVADSGLAAAGDAPSMFLVIKLSGSFRLPSPRCTCVVPRNARSVQEETSPNADEVGASTRSSTTQKSADSAARKLCRFCRPQTLLIPLFTIR